MPEEVVWTAVADHHLQQAYELLQVANEGCGELPATHDTLNLPRRFPEMPTGFGAEP